MDGLPAAAAALGHRIHLLSVLVEGGTLSVVYGPGKADRLACSVVPESRSRNKALAKAFGARLRSIRLEKGMTQEGLAHAAGLHPTYISNCERGYSAPTLETLVRIAAAVGVKPGQLIDDLAMS